MQLLLVSLLSFCRSTNSLRSFWQALARRRYFLLPGFLFVSPLAQAQSDTIDKWINDQIAFVEATYYYDDLDRALASYQRIAEVARTHTRWYLKLETEIQMTWCAMHHQRLDTLPGLLSQAEATVRAHRVAFDTLDPNHTQRLNIPYTWGLYYTYTDDQVKAIEAYRKIVANQQALTDSSLVADTYYSIASSYAKLGNHQQAIIYYRRSITWIPKQTYGQQYAYHKALALRALGTSYLNQGLDRKDSLLLGRVNKLYARSLRLLSPYEDKKRGRHAIMAGYRALANWHRINKNYDSALYYLQQSSAFFRPLDPQLVRTYNLWGDLHLEQHQFDRAREYYQKSLRITTNTYGDQHPEKATVLHRIAKSYQSQTRWSDALSYLQRALAQLTNNTDSVAGYQNPSLVHLTPPNRFLLNILLTKAEVLYQISLADNTEALLAALNTYQLAADVIDLMRQTFPSLEYKQFVSAKATSLYEQAIRASLRAHELKLSQRDFLAEAFYFSEKGKAATLLEAVKTSEARSFAGIPSKLLAQENELKRELTYWENELYQASDDLTRQLFRNRAFETREAYNALIRQLEQEYPNYYQLKYDTEVTNLAQVRAQLADHTTLLSFSYGDSTLYAFTVRPDTVHYHTVALDSLFRQQLENVLQTVSQYNYAQADDPLHFRQFTRDAHALYQTLVHPSLTAASTAERLIVIPDGLLGYLPFDVLLTEASTDSKIDYGGLSYLVKQLPISYEYSATLLTSSFASQQKASEPYLGFAPSYQDAPLAQSREVRATLDGQPLGLGQLRYNREEVAFASNLFGGATFTGEVATEAHFKQRAHQGQLLHLSMHAYAHDKNDDFSGLIFTQQPDSASEDGFLHANELYNLSLSAELAVLSACETGIGTLAPGEGIMSLGRAFKYAGCPNVTMSLWTADDQSTNRIMQRFFTQLHDGQAKDKALRTAKLGYLQEARSAQAHPYYWAAFAQVGNAEPLTVNRGRAIKWWIGGGVGFVLLLIVLVFLYRRVRG